MDAETERARRIWEKEASGYDRGIRPVQGLLFGDGRQWVCSQAAGEVLEIAVGTGLNFPYYPRGVRLTGIDFSSAMLEIAGRRAQELDFPVRLRAADAQALPFGDASFDTVVCTLSLCSIPDDRRAVGEVARVLRPAGLFLLLEHVRSRLSAVSAVQRFLDPLAVRFQADHLVREPLEPLRAEGFEIERVERSRLGIVERVRARKPGRAQEEAEAPP